jgi:hypothetical protein
MPTLTSYPFQQAYDIPSLTTEIQASSIVTVLDHIDVTGTMTDVWFKDALSTADQTTLNAVVAAYTYIPPAAPAPIKTIQILGADTLSLSPFGALISPAANTLTNCDVEIPMSVVLRGGVVFSQNSAIGDWISVSVIDKNNVVGAGGTADNPTILATYIASWYLMPGVVNSVEDVSISQLLPQGLYMRIAYTSVGSVAPSVVINFITYVGTP